MARGSLNQPAQGETVESQTTALTNWDEELANQAKIAAGMEANTGGNQYFSVRGGVLTLADMPIAGNHMAVVMLDAIFENVYYAGEYDPDTPQPPTCFAFGRDEAEMAPHPSVVERGQQQHETCRGCPMNVFGTADRGKGKACRNTRRIGMIPAGELSGSPTVFKAYTDEEHFATATPAYMKLPVTSVKGYSTFVKSVAASLKRPPRGIFAKILVVPDAKTQFKVICEPLAAIPSQIIPIIMKRHDEVAGLIEQPYPLDVVAVEERPTSTKTGKNSAAVRKAGGKY